MFFLLLQKKKKKKKKKKKHYYAMCIYKIRLFEALLRNTHNMGFCDEIRAIFILIFILSVVT